MTTPSYFAAVRAHFGDDDPRPPRRAVVPMTRTGDRSAWAEAAFAAEVGRVAGATPGTRNHALNRAAFALGQIVAGGSLDETDVVLALEDAAHAAGLGHAETVATIRSGLHAGYGDPRAAPAPTGPATPLPAFTVPPGPTTAPAGPLGGAQADHGAPVGPDVDADRAVALVEAVTRSLPRLDWTALWADDSAEEWIVEPLLPARRLVSLYSAPKLGKSLLMLELAVAISRGVSVLGVTPDRPRRVLYVDFENDPRGDIRERLQAMGVGPDDLDGLVYLSFPVLAALDSARGGAELLAAISVYACEVVVVDTISRAIAGEENDNDTWLAFYRHTGLALKQAGVALIRLDHTGKDEGKGQRGGSAKSGDVDVVWRMSKVSEGVFRLDCEAARLPIAEKTLVVRRLGGPLRHVVDPAGRAGAWRAQVTEAVGHMDRLGLPDDTGREKASHALRAVGLRARNNVLADAVRTRKERPGDPLENLRPAVENLSPNGGDRSVPEHLSPNVGDRWGQAATDDE